MDARGKRSARPRRSDVIRQVSVLVGAAVAIVAAAAGVGAFGGASIAEAADGALAADATVLAPGSPAFGIWSLIYIGLAAFAVFQALPAQATNPRLRMVSWWVLLSMLLNAAWIGMVQAGLLGLSVAVIAALVAVLAIVAVWLVRARPATLIEAWLTDGTVGLYLGWTAVASIANVTALLASEDVGPLLLGQTGWGVILMVVAGALSVALAVFARHDPALAVGVGLAMSWGLMWIALGRITDTPESLIVGWAAGIAGAIAFGAPFAAIDFSSGDHRMTSRPRRD